jgi:hypothetical protein
MDSQTYIHNKAKTVQERLAVLWHKLEGDGMYVGANTVSLAQDLIAELTGVAPILLDSNTKNIDS